MLEGINDYLSTLPQTLQWISRTLNDLTGIPWPLWLGGLFPIYLAALSIAIWILRGTSWPVRCAYPVTKAKIPCRIFVPGEWMLPAVWRLISAVNSMRRPVSASRTYGRSAGAPSGARGLRHLPRSVYKQAETVEERSNNETPGLTDPTPTGMTRRQMVNKHRASAHKSWK